MNIYRKVRLRNNQSWNPRISVYLHEVPYYDWRIAIYSEGVWESQELNEAVLGGLYPNENPRLVYEHEIMTANEYNEWTTFSGVNI